MYRLNDWYNYRDTIIIPVVFHTQPRDGAENISKEQVLDAPQDFNSEISATETQIPGHSRFLPKCEGDPQN
ncbi:MAG: hypothetical protein IPL08_15185 [Saprospiraceae bacterium]|nr:hypothetical protein [Saprospiraceae bacterium]